MHAPFAVPHPRNRLFVGRNDELATLEAWLTVGSVSVAVGGAGGLGKTALAVEYAYGAWERGQYPGGVFWLVMDNVAGVAGQIAAFAGPQGLALLDWEPGAFERNHDRVLAAWQEPVVRLLVFDNCEDPALLAQWRPRVGGCRVLITSRNQVWPARLAVRVLSLSTLPRPDSYRVLLTPRAAAAGHSADTLLGDAATAREAETLCKWLGDLPLALTLAAAYLESHPSLSLAAYQAELQRTPVDHPSLNPPRALEAIIRHEPSLWYTFLRSYLALDESVAADEQALALLHGAAGCAPGVPIPRRLLLRAAKLNPDASGDQVVADEAMGRLASLGLITPRPRTVHGCCIGCWQPVCEREPNT